MQSEIIYKVTEIDLRKVLADFVKEEEGKVFDKYYNVIVDAKTVANIHGTTPQTIIRHVKSGAITTEPSEGRVYRFRLSEVLKLDFQKLKHKRHGSRTYTRSLD